MRSKEQVPQDMARDEAERRTAPGLLALEMMHEVRNSLEALNNLLYLSLESTGGPEEVRRYLRLAQLMPKLRIRKAILYTYLNK